MHAGTAFDELDDYLALGRLSHLSMSTDGRRLVLAHAELDDDAVKYVTSLWEVDPTGNTAARRLTWGAESETAPVFTSDGDVLFLASRPLRGGEDCPKALWRLPAGGGEACRVTDFADDVDSVLAARAAPRFLLTTPLLDAADSVAEDRRIRKERKDKKVSAILHSGYPVRHWDDDLGPGAPHLFSGSLDTGGGSGDAPVDLTPLAGAALRDADVDLSWDGEFAVTTWAVPAAGAAMRTVLVKVDTGTGEQSLLVDDLGVDVSAPAISPDGASVAYLREAHSTDLLAPRTTLHLFDLRRGTSELVDVGDLWPTSPVWSADGTELLFTADHRGRAPIFRVRVGSAGSPSSAESPVSRITTDDAAYSDVCVAPDGQCAYALRASYEAPPHPVRVDLVTGAVSMLPAPEALPELPGTLTEVQTKAADGTAVRGWLALPTGAEAHAPVPLLLWVHGGPLSSWNTWSWRWNPWLLVAQGYAVLLPDPALSTGYGQSFVQRGWGRWGAEPYTDLMAITDTAVARPEIDAERTGAMGGSFGGYMANWIAGHTGRFKAIVSHASLWALDQFGPTTDSAWYWQREMTPEMAVENSPHLYVADIVTPMLVIHGDRDYRVPIGEGLRLWFELLSESGLPADEEGATAHRFLYFPDENHWVLAPQHTKLWYEVVRAFLSEHVLGEAAEMPEILG
ncbi:Dipeptidyl aminopeptidase/acylaminoacyl peptidase [Rhodococcus triatomae]|uniref:Dipeptidyl aminopeptidase/acylaminoacyl peptidase n=2 Tax=Rhodococcus triatomae TaxID=300028 RepID=A0A1G8DRA2_9NOCA|nr:S9 family peptidase [Rhodococcus triatomae]QNG21251.1 S9 family peptidase [Rhodococcus triatomae]SDH60178.1 Dipeptidyl aminopeptidase/acylaminoacyl peptidase [Rhodococcus triatomae]